MASYLLFAYHPETDDNYLFCIHYFVCLNLEYIVWYVRKLTYIQWVICVWRLGKLKTLMKLLTRWQFISQANLRLEFQEVSYHCLLLVFDFFHAYLCSYWWCDASSFCLRQDRPGQKTLVYVLRLFSATHLLSPWLSLSKTEWAASCQFKCFGWQFLIICSRKHENNLLESNKKDSFDTLQGNIRGKCLL